MLRWQRTQLHHLYQRRRQELGGLHPKDCGNPRGPRLPEESCNGPITYSAKTSSACVMVNKPRNQLNTTPRILHHNSVYFHHRWESNGQKAGFAAVRLMRNEMQPVLLAVVEFVPSLQLQPIPFLLQIHRLRNMRFEVRHLEDARMTALAVLIPGLCREWHPPFSIQLNKVCHHRLAMHPSSGGKQGILKSKQ